jgi:hypothetical protein
MAAFAAASAGLQFLAIREQNKANAKAFVNNVYRIKTSFEKQVAQVQEQAESVQDEIRLEQSKVRYKALEESATSSNRIVEQNIAGATASRLYDQVAIKSTQANNALAKAAEDKLVEFGVLTENLRDRANQSIINAGIQADMNHVGFLEGVASVAGAGASGAQLGSVIGG